MIEDGVLGAGLLALLSAFTCAYGLLYLTRATFMPHHAAAIGKTWDELDARMQWMMRTYVNAMGVSILSCGLFAIGLIVLHLQRPDRLIIAILAAGLAVHWGLIGFLAWRLQRVSGAATRWRGGPALAVLALIGLALAW